MFICFSFLNLLPPLLRNFFIRLLCKNVGSKVFIDYGVCFRFPSRISIGHEVTIGRGCSFYPSYFTKDSQIKILNNVRIGPNVSFNAAGHDYRTLSLDDVGGSIVVEDNVWIGANSVILQNVIIGEGAVVAAGSVVTKSVEPYTIVAGMPAKRIKNRTI